MGVYYPQVSVLLRIMLEDFGDSTNDDLKKVYDLPVLVRSATVSINNYTEADTFNLEVDYKYFPFDPRTIRSCGVTIFMEDMKKLYDADGKKQVIEPSRKNTIFIGFADEDSISLDDNSRKVTLTGRDFTSLLIDRPYLSGNLNVEKPIDQVINKLLSELKETVELKVVNRTNAALPNLARYWSEKDKLSGKKNVRKDESYWDVIQNVVNRAGLISYIELDKLIITKPRVLYDNALKKVFVYGKNVKTLEFKRKLGRRKGFNILVRSLNIEKKQVI